MPGSCFEIPNQSKSFILATVECSSENLSAVHWDYEAEKDGELTVKQGDTVTLVDHDAATGLKNKVHENALSYIVHGCMHELCIASTHSLNLSCR